MNMPVLERNVQGKSKLSFVDCDIHPIQRSEKDLHPYLSAHWREHMSTFGGHVRQGLIGQVMHPRMMAAGQRADSYPKNGGPPGSDLELMQQQHLDFNGVETTDVITRIVNGQHAYVIPLRHPIKSIAEMERSLME